MNLKISALVLFILGSCEQHNPPPIPPQPPALPSSYDFSLDPVQWQFSFSPGMPRNPREGLEFDFPQGPDTAAAPSVHYLTRASPGSPTGQKLIIDWEVSEVGTVVYNGALGDVANNCGPPAYFSLYLQRRGDDLKGTPGTTEFYRWFARIATLRPGLGSAVVSLNGEGWVGVLGKSGKDYPAQFAATLASLDRVGLTFGWGCFSGHGVNVQTGTGSSVFRIKRLATGD